LKDYHGFLRPSNLKVAQLEITNLPTSVFLFLKIIIENNADQPSKNWRRQKEKG